MNILLNGQPTQTDCKTLLELVQSLELNNKRFAVEQNECIVPKSKLAETPLAEQDRIEIIQAVGGG